ncbi:MAG: YraN family protein [Patescibacteria group bacterium]|nr:YraN family protein [Patescibacteria group bacterium]
MTFYKKNFGKIGEEKACQYLQNHDFKIIKKNFRTKWGEIDIIALKDKILYFIEVKTRSNINKGYPYEAVKKYKINHIKKTSYFFILNSKYKDYKMKIGVISIVLENNNEIINFFDDLE